MNRIRGPVNYGTYKSPRREAEPDPERYRSVADVQGKSSRRTNTPKKPAPVKKPSA